MRRNKPSSARNYLLKVASDARNAARSGMTKDDCPYFDHGKPAFFTTKFDAMRSARRQWIAAFEEESAKMATEEPVQGKFDV